MSPRHDYHVRGPVSCSQIIIIFRFTSSMGRDALQFEARRKRTTIQPQPFMERGWREREQEVGENSEDETQRGRRKSYSFSSITSLSISLGDGAWGMAPVRFQVQIIFCLIFLSFINYLLGTLLPTNPSQQVTVFFGCQGETVGN